MKRLILIIIAILFIGQSYAREIININRDWQFFTNISKSSDNAKNVNLPHTWNKDALSGKQDYFRGVGNYQKHINIPLQWRNKRVFIRFQGAGTVTDLIVNGRYVGEHRGGYTAFTFEVTSFLKYGEDNMFWVIVNNAPQMDVLPTAGDINIYGGLYRDVELIVTEPSHISVRDYSSDGVYLTQRNVTQEKAEVDALVKIDGLANRNLTVNLSVITPRKDTILRQSARFRVPASGQGEVKMPFIIETPNLWNGTKNPYLYDVAVEIMDDTLLCDGVNIPMGLRYFTMDSHNGFYLNGEPYPLKGVVAYEDRAGVGLALTPYQIKEDLDLITEMGANAVRAAAYPHNKAFYEECDRRGILVWSDMPFIGPAYITDRAYIDTENFRENGRNQLVEMIRQRYNNPSVLTWGLFSNLTLVGDNPTGYIMELNNLAGEEDPKRVCVASSNQDGDINFITDLIAWTHSFGWTEGQPSDIKVWIDSFKANWSQLRSGIIYGAGGNIYHQDDSLYRPVYYGNWHPERWQTYFHEQYYANLVNEPMFWGKFVANMFDYGSAARPWGNDDGVNDMGLVTFDRKYRKDAFYFYKANWNEVEPFVYIAERRWDDRTHKEQKLRVFSNEGEAELIVNGVSLGKKTGINGTYEWDAVLNDGDNLIEARTATSTDNIIITVHNDNINHNIK